MSWKLDHDARTHLYLGRYVAPFCLAWILLDGEIRVPPLPTPPAASAGRPGSDRFRGQPHRHIAAANEGPVVGRPVRHAIFRLVCGMDLRLHPCRVAPAEGHEKCRPNRPTPSGSSCNNACAGKARSRGTRCRDVIFETLFETLWVTNPIRPRSAASRNRVMRGPGVTQGAKRSQGARRPRD